MRTLALLLSLTVMAWPSSTHASDDVCEGDPQCTVTTGSGGFGTSVETTVGGNGDPGAPGSGGPVEPTDLVGDGLDAVCVITAIESGRNPVEFCGLDTDDGDPPELTPGMIVAAFRTIQPPPSVLVVQPPNGRTLVNFETNFYTETQPFETSLNLLGHTIAFRIRPATFTWDYGDGTVESTETPGAAYPDLEITHVYERRGAVAPSVDTTYAATYQVDGQGPWLDVDGTVTVTGEAAGLEVLTATPVLVGYDG